MAKWGEGDPRWIVEERPDATNVNNWHWTEKNADAWSKRKLEELFVGGVFDDPGVGRVEVVKMEKCDGEARVNNRKAKLILFYEWDIKLEWTGRANGGGEEDVVRGTVSIPNLSEEHEDVADVDLEVAVTTDPSGKGARALKEMMRTGSGARGLRSRLRGYVDALKTEYASKGVILPARDAKEAAAPPAPQQQQAGRREPTASAAATASSASRQMEGLRLRPATATLEMEERFKCTGQELYNVLTQREMMGVFSGGEVTLGEGGEAREGATFEMIGGNVVGTFVRLEPFTRLEQRWRLRSWPEGHFSRVEMEIRQSADDTCLKLRQSDVPERELEATRQGWQRYYWEAIRRAFGFGSRIY